MTLIMYLFSNFSIDLNFKSMEMEPKEQLKRKISEELKTKEQIAKISFDVEELRC